MIPKEADEDIYMGVVLAHNRTFDEIEQDIRYWYIRDNLQQKELKVWVTSCTLYKA